MAPQHKSLLLLPGILLCTVNTFATDQDPAASRDPAGRRHPQPHVPSTQSIQEPHIHSQKGMCRHLVGIVEGQLDDGWRDGGYCARSVDVRPHLLERPSSRMRVMFTVGCSWQFKRGTTRLRVETLHPTGKLRSPKKKQH